MAVSQEVLWWGVVIILPNAFSFGMSQNLKKEVVKLEIAGLQIRKKCLVCNPLCSHPNPFEDSIDPSTEPVLVRPLFLIFLYLAVLYQLISAWGTFLQFLHSKLRKLDVWSYYSVCIIRIAKSISLAPFFVTVYWWFSPLNLDYFVTSSARSIIIPVNPLWHATEMLKNEGFMIKLNCTFCLRYHHCIMS